VSASSEHATSTANASLFSTKVRIPLLQEEFAMLDDEALDNRELVALKPTV
jgi:hypothetical protein